MRATCSRARLRRVLGRSAALALVSLAAAGTLALAQTSQLPAFLRPQQPPPNPLGQPATPPPSTPRSARTATAPPSPVVARVGTHEITQAEFDRVAQPYFARLRSEMGPALTPDVQRTATLNVLDELVRRELLAVEVERSRLEVSQDEIDALLRQDPYFLTNGQFDAAKLRLFKTSPSSNYLVMLPRLREMAAVKKLDDSLRKRFAPSPAQLKAEWARRSDRVRFELLPVLDRDISLEPESSPAEWAAYYAAHADQFLRRTRLRLRYARLPLPAAGDSTRPEATARAFARARALADSLRRGTLPDSSAVLDDTGLFEVPPGMIPGFGRVQGLTDTLIRADADTAIHVVGPYLASDAVLVGVVAERQPKHVPPLPEVLGDVKRRADAESRRAADDRDRRAYYDRHRGDWRGPRVTLTRVALDVSRLPVKPATAQDVERWYAAHGPTLFGRADSSRAWVPPLGDSLRGVVRERLAGEQRPRLAAEAMERLAAALRTNHDARASARAEGAAAETLSFTRSSPADTLFGVPFVDSLLAAPGAAGVPRGPRTFGTHAVVWRVDAVDTAFVPPYEAVRARSDQGFAEEQRLKDEADGRAYYDQHRDEFKTPLKYGFDYVTVRVPAPDSVRVSEAELRRRYEANARDYRQEEQVKARHILFMTRGLTPDAERAVRVRADSLLAAIRKDGGDFTELARRFSQEPGAATSGGDLGWFGRGRMVKEFEDAAFALKPGEISGVVKSQFGYHIIRVEDRKAAGTRPFEEVRDAIRAQIAQARGDSTARRSAEALRRRLAMGGDAKSLAAAHGGLVTAAPVAANEALPSLGYVPGLSPDLTTMTPGHWAPNVYRTGDRYVVMRLREQTPPRPATFEEVKTPAVEAMRAAKRRALMTRKVEAIRAALAAGASLDSLAGPYGGLKDSGLLTQTASFVPALGNEPRLVEKAFTLRPGERTDTLQVAQGTVWIRLAERKPGDPAAFKTASPMLEAELVKKQYDAWVEQQKRTVPVVVLRADLKGPRPPAGR